mmetsp:Transcript_537/g.1652  ORF Transcript_537/g.1652 Transcript_537/m.1652 type:complete len:212 (-) Transcript_537:423-1058(-)
MGSRHTGHGRAAAWRLAARPASSSSRTVRSLRCSASRPFVCRSSARTRCDSALASRARSWNRLSCSSGVRISSASSSSQAASSSSKGSSSSSSSARRWARAWAALAILVHSASRVLASSARAMSSASRCSPSATSRCSASRSALRLLVASTAAASASCAFIVAQRPMQVAWNTCSQDVCTAASSLPHSARQMLHSQASFVSSRASQTSART